MPASTKKSSSRMKSKSPSRSRSRSRGRSKSRGRPPGRKAKQSPSPARKEKTPKRESTRTPKVTKTPSTPTRKSARIAEQIVEKEKDESQTESEKKTSSTKRSAIKEQEPEVSKPSYEFGGPVGVFFLTLLLPAFILFINLSLNQGATLTKLPSFPRQFAAYFNAKAACVYLGWIAFQVLLANIPVGRVVDGQPLKGGKKLKYRCNGFFAFAVSIATFTGLMYLKYDVAFVYNSVIQLASTAICFAFVLSVALYLKARKLNNSQRSAGGNTGCATYDFFMGAELNPRIGNFDLKFFSELRPGLIGWVMLNALFVAESCRQTGGSPNPALLLVTLFQTWYVAEALWFEDGILTTMDITHDGLGYMLALGDLAWVPFMYCLQGRYLVLNPQEWSNMSLVGFAILNLVGYIIFRGSNSQKTSFRRNPHDPALSHLETLPTSTGKKLLVSGWWGICRHPNYLGDLIMAVAWSLPCGFSSGLPFFYPVYFLLLLVDRARRDDTQCRAKYGAAWDRYCQRVKYRIFPYVY